MLTELLLCLSFLVLLDIGLGYFRFGRERFFGWAYLFSLEKNYPEIFEVLSGWRSKLTDTFPTLTASEKDQVYHLIRQVGYWLTTHLHCDWILKTATLVLYRRRPPKGCIGEAGLILFSPYLLERGHFLYPGPSLKERVRRFLCNRSYFFNEVTCDQLLKISQEIAEPVYQQHTNPVLHFCLGQRLLPYEKLHIVAESLAEISGFPSIFCELYPEPHKSCGPHPHFGGREVLDSLRQNRFDGEISVHLLLNPLGFGGANWCHGIALPRFLHRFGLKKYPSSYYIVYILVHPVSSSRPRLLAIKEFSSLFLLERYLDTIWHRLFGFKEEPSPLSENNEPLGTKNPVQQAATEKKAVPKRKRQSKTGNEGGEKKP